MSEHRPVTAVIKGTGFNSNGGGFSRIEINGSRHHPDDVASAVASAPTLAAENAALKALVAEMVNEAALWRQLIIVQASFVSVGDVESSPLIEDMDALIARAKEAAS